MTVGEISKPIVSTDNILFLKLVDKRSLKLNMSKKNNLRDNLIAQKKMNYLVYILEVICLK